MLKSSKENAQPRVARVYDIANCGPRHRFVANGKLVSNCNLQNLKRGGELRRSILAPKGHVVVVAEGDGGMPPLQAAAPTVRSPAAHDRRRRR